MLRLVLVFFGLLALALACAAPAKDAPDDEGVGGDVDDSDDDEHEREGDDAGECSDAADNDVDGDFDCEDDDCEGSPDCAVDETLHISGVVEGRLYVEEERDYVPCDGTFSFEVDADGRVSGDADCAFDGGLGSAEGEVSGELDGERFSGTWSADMAWFAFSTELEGTWRGGALEASFEVESEVGPIDGTFTGEAE